MLLVFSSKGSIRTNCSKNDIFDVEDIFNAYYFTFCYENICDSVAFSLATCKLQVGYIPRESSFFSGDFVLCFHSVI